MLRKTIYLLTAISLLANGKITAQPEKSTTVPLTSPTTASMSLINPTEIFSGDRAMEDLISQVNGGPRLPNSPGLTHTRQLINRTLEQNGFHTATQHFEVQSPLLKQLVAGENIFGIYPKGSSVKYVISAHYDTRPYADQDPDPSRHLEPVQGANDGASGVAVLLELARALPKTNLSHGVALVFFDIEDHGAAGSAEGFCLGSKHFALNLPAELKDFQYGINLDMVADQDLQLPMEGYSLAKAPQLTFDLWTVGHNLYPTSWIKEKGRSIYDDHMPFLGIGKAYIDVIDFDYPSWHTTQDTIDKCSPKSLDIVGDTILTFIHR